jgi:hypothetical protein
MGRSADIRAIERAIGGDRRGATTWAEAALDALESERARRHGLSMFWISIGLATLMLAGSVAALLSGAPDRIDAAITLGVLSAAIVVAGAASRWLNRTRD